MENEKIANQSHQTFSLIAGESDWTIESLGLKIKEKRIIRYEEKRRLVKIEFRLIERRESESQNWEKEED